MTGLSGLADALKLVFNKLASFFDIIDLSFFASGSLALAAFAFHLHLIDVEHQGEIESQAAVRAETKARLETQLQQATDRASSEEARIQLARAKLLTLAAKADDAPEVKHWRDSEIAAIKAKATADGDAANATGALAANRHEEERFQNRQPLIETLITGQSPLLILAGIYVLGLISFAIGSLAQRAVRWLHRDDEKRRTQDLEHARRLRELCAEHDVEDQEPFRAFVQLWKEPPEGHIAVNRSLTSACLARLWTWARESERPTFEHINRYWVRAAIYEGLVPALVVCACVAGFWALDLDAPFFLLLTPLFIIAAVACWTKAHDTRRALVDEVVVAVVEDIRLSNRRNVTTTETATVDATGTTETKTETTSKPVA